MAKKRETVIKAVYPLPSVNPEAFIALESARQAIAEAEQATKKARQVLPIQVILDEQIFGLRH